MSDAGMKVGELRTYSRRINLVAKIIEKGEEREVFSSQIEEAIGLLRHS